MANYAYVEEFNIVELHDNLPGNWRNISNFYALSDEEITQFGWKKVEKAIPDFDPTTQRLVNQRHYILNDTVYESYDVENLPEPVVIPQEVLLQQQWDNIRNTRDKLMGDFEWRYARYERQTRLQLPTTDNLENMDLYMQALADITLQTDPYNINWPNYTEQ